MAAFYDFFTEEYGGIPAYLRQIGVSDEALTRLRNKFVAPNP